MGWDVESEKSIGVGGRGGFGARSHEYRARWKIYVYELRNLS